MRRLDAFEGAVLVAMSAVVMLVTAVIVGLIRRCG
jgi:hypothetical protein